jgi:hypothetical protein
MLIAYLFLHFCRKAQFGPTVCHRMKHAPGSRMPHESCAEPPGSGVIECAVGRGVKGLRNKSRVVGDIETPPMVANLIDRAATAFDSDIDVARVLLFRAAVALRAARAPNGRPVDRSAVSTVRRVLAPWQLDRICAYIEANDTNRSFIR